MSVSSRSGRLAVVALVLGLMAVLGVGRALAADAETQPATHPALPVKVEVKLSSSTMKPGAACTAKVTVTNTSSAEVLVKGGKNGPDVQPACWRRGERIVVALGQYEPEGQELVLKPGESATVTLDLTAMYKLQTPGQYLFSATIQFSTNELSMNPFKSGDKPEDRVWLPSFREAVNFTVGD